VGLAAHEPVGTDVGRFGVEGWRRGMGSSAVVAGAGGGSIGRPFIEITAKVRDGRMAFEVNSSRVSNVA